MKGNLLQAFIVLMLVVGCAHALSSQGSSSSSTTTTGTTTSGVAEVGVTNTTSVPSTIYPGTQGVLQVTLSNDGTATASAVSIYYTAQNVVPNTVFAGDLTQGATSTVSIPFTVPVSYNASIYIIYLNVYYQSSQTTGSSTMNTPISVPLEISQHEVLSANTVSIAPSQITPGDNFNVTLQLVNTGGTTNNIMITTAANSSFTLAGTTQETVGSISPGGNMTVIVPVSTSSSAASGKYAVPLALSYQDQLQNTVTQTLSVGPITVFAPSAQFVATLTPLSTVEVGAATPFALTLENQGGSTATASVTINQSSVFQPIGSSTIYFDNLAPGANMTQTVSIGTNPSSTAGFYNLPLIVTANGLTYEQDTGIVVDAASQLDLTYTTSPQFISSGNGSVTVTVNIANTGNAAIRSVAATAQGNDQVHLVGNPDKFIGTLNIDDFATFPVTVSIAPGLAAGTYDFPVSISFKDSMNNPQTITQNIDLQVLSAGDAARFGAAGNLSGGFGRGRATGLFGISFLSLSDPVGIIIVVIVLALLYFGYKRWKNGKKQAPLAHQKK